jgi:ribosomal protein S15P/S13E
MEDEEQIRLLMSRVKSLQDKIKSNPQYTQDTVDLIYMDIQYYLNQIEFLVHNP